MTQSAGEFLSRHKHALTWLHIGAVIGTLCAALPALAHTRGPLPVSVRVLLIFAIATVAWCQNIGLVHHCIHHLPRGPRWLGLGVARLLNYLGGLPYTQIRFAHLLHHAWLGTERDPDRAGYQTTTTLAKRLRYLFFIGPLRARFAPVDTAAALDAMAPSRAADHARRCRRDRWLVVLTHLALLALYGFYYPVVLAALLFANVLSNVREMAEHGSGDGRAAYVDIGVSLPGVLFVSTPGFWFHGLHHTDASIHCLDLPLAARTVAMAEDRPYLKRRSAAAYLLTGR